MVFFGCSKYGEDVLRLFAGQNGRSGGIGTLLKGSYKHHGYQIALNIITG